MKYVQVPAHEAQAMEDIKSISQKGHSADVKYIEKEDTWIIYDVEKKRRERRGQLER